MQKIATVSLAEPLGALAEGLGSSFAAWGFAIVADHGIPAAAIAMAQERMRAFFALPEAVKRRYHVPGLAGARGYTPFGVERAVGASAHDLKEFWHVGRDVAPGGDAARMPANLWPDEVPGFREASLALYAAFETTGARLLEAIALSLGLAPGFFGPAIDGGNSVLRYLHYPPLAGAPEGAVRAASHADINAITLLLGAEEAGLELRDRAGRWWPVNPPPGALVVNVGDMLERLSGGRLPSSVHRVVNPAGAAARRGRHSMPFFLHFRPDYLIEPLGGRGEPILADDFLQQRLRAIGLA